LQLQLQWQDAGRWLTRLGRPGVLQGGHGQLTGQLHWAGPPLGADWDRVNGELQLALAQGQLLQIEPGLAKWLGVLNLHALPRRFSLDFGDVVNAAALLQGQVDLARKTQDLQAVAVPHLNADTVSLVATAINPALGLSSFAWQWLLRQPLQYATTQRWHISGGWQAPRIEKLPHPPSGTGNTASPAAATLPAALDAAIPTHTPHATPP
ncbi:MAG: AsmA-like C-terminal region-containing protein, partial [Macromonas sp.]